MKNKTSNLSFGTVISVRGRVVDIRFDEHLSPIYSVLQAVDGGIVIEVLSQLVAHRVRGAAVEDTSRSWPGRRRCGLFYAGYGSGSSNRGSRSSGI